MKVKTSKKIAVGDLEYSGVRRQETKHKLRFLLSCIDNAAKLETAINTMSMFGIDFNHDQASERMDAAVQDEITIGKFADKMPRTYGWKFAKNSSSEE